MISIPLYKPDERMELNDWLALVAAVREAIQRHKLTSNATLARRVVAARKVA